MLVDPMIWLGDSSIYAQSTISFTHAALSSPSVSGRVISHFSGRVFKFYVLFLILLSLVNSFWFSVILCSLTSFVLLRIPPHTPNQPSRFPPTHKHTHTPFYQPLFEWLTFTRISRLRLSISTIWTSQLYQVFLTLF